MPGSAAGNDDLTVEYARFGQQLSERVHEFGKVAGERLRAAAAECDAVAVELHDAAKAVPFRLVAVAAVDRILVGDCVDRFGEHRFGLR